MAVRSANALLGFFRQLNLRLNLAEEDTEEKWRQR